MTYLLVWFATCVFIALTTVAMFMRYFHETPILLRSADSLRRKKQGETSQQRST